ncbi:aspartate carbamoyltransferase catalytic subunit [Mesobacterium sp. TK19101]|uniref:Aspartate carbamoyltransferase catalytic subunit n=1 Tax=Mesobacterium hydrothermale TaxID=3111907 RepID=A0ABU6HLL6_9RHOB|nr:aspartate carbamoyltransferase catalytic subunit [Mesobacterium sp. TK19101]MEC3862735.1 aspartate carbamoyltransferase catalytic subunit [Mesobacterium sp. TK19101]
MAQAPDGWDGILDPNETILWQGRPDAGLNIGPANILTAVFGTFFSGFALFWMIMAMQAGGAFWMFGLIHFSVGIGIVVTALFGTAFVRRHTWYTLTDRRAFIATNMPVIGRKLKSYPITGDTVLEFDDADLPSIWFAQDYRRTKRGHRTVKRGFERLPDARTVYQSMRDIQRKAG